MLVPSHVTVVAWQVPFVHFEMVQPGVPMAAVVMLSWQSLSRTQSTQPAVVQNLRLPQVLVCEQAP